MDKAELINNKLTEVRNLIEEAMKECLEENDKKAIVFDHPIVVANNEDYDIPGKVYSVSLDKDNNVALTTSWRDDVDYKADYFVDDFCTDDLEWIYARMLVEE